MKKDILISQITTIIMIIASVVGCNRPQISQPIPSSPVIPQIPIVTPIPPPPTHGLSTYTFSATVDPVQYYMFYLHGKIIEDQGIPAISPDYGEYEYLPILEKLSSYGFVVISEQRPKNTEPAEYARKISMQVEELLKAGVPAGNISVVGASKGAGIAILVSYLLENREINYVIMGICDPASVEGLIQNNIFLYGNVLSIYDSTDQQAGSCRKLFTFSEGKGISRYNEVILNVGTGHGVLYKPLDEWVLPAVHWAGQP